MEIVLDELELLGLDLAAGLASVEGTLLHAILELDRLSVGPGDVLAEAIPILFEVSIDIIGQLVLRNLFLNERVNLILFGSSRVFSLVAVVVI